MMMMVLLPFIPVPLLLINVNSNVSTFTDGIAISISATDKGIASSVVTAATAIGTGATAAGGTDDDEKGLVPLWRQSEPRCSKRAMKRKKIETT